MTTKTKKDKKNDSEQPIQIMHEIRSGHDMQLAFAGIFKTMEEAGYNLQYFELADNVGHPRQLVIVVQGRQHMEQMLDVARRIEARWHEGKEQSNARFIEPQMLEKLIQAGRSLDCHDFGQVYFNPVTATVNVVAPLLQGEPDDRDVLKFNETSDDDIIDLFEDIPGVNEADVLYEQKPSPDAGFVLAYDPKSEKLDRTSV